MSSIAEFAFENSNIRFVDDLPVGIDIARALGYADPKSAVKDLVKLKNKCRGEIPTIRYGENKPRIEKVTLLKEPGIYHVIIL